VVVEVRGNSVECDSLDKAKGLADFLHVSVALVRKLSRRADFPVVRVGRATRFDRAAVLAWLREHETQRREAKKDGAAK